jgi:hypothetical protein
MRDQRSGLSIHEYTRDVRLPNWGRWGRHNPDRPKDWCGASHIYGMGRADKQGEQTTADGLLTNADEDAPNPIDEIDAENIDGWIRQLADLHKQIIRAKFYKYETVLLSDTDAAVRALLDLMAENRQVVDAMKGMGWT